MSICGLRDIYSCPCMQDVFITTLLSSHLNILAGPSQSWILIFKSDQYIPSILDYKTFQLSRYIAFSIGPMEKKTGWWRTYLTKTSREPTMDLWYCHTQTFNDRNYYINLEGTIRIFFYKFWTKALSHAWIQPGSHAWSWGSSSQLASLWYTFLPNFSIRIDIYLSRPSSWIFGDATCPVPRGDHAPSPI